MAAVSESMVREYFELHGFLVRQQRKFVAPSRREEEKQVDFIVLNPAPLATESALPFVLGSEHLSYLARGVVIVKGWHTETFGPGMLAGAPNLFRFIGPAVFRRGEKALGGNAPVTRILVVPALPQDEATRQRSIEFLRGKGLDAVLPFRTILTGLIERVEANRNYQKSGLLQTLRILKNYDLFREAQLELFRSRSRRPRSSSESAAPAADSPA